MKLRDRQNPRTIEVPVRFNDEEKAYLDAMAEKLDKSRAAIIRDLVISHAFRLQLMDESNTNAA